MRLHGESMNYKNHLKWGITAICGLIIALTYFRAYIDIGLYDNSNVGLLNIFIPNIIIAAIIGIYASIFPDIDIGTSKAFTITFMLLIVLAFYFMYAQYIIGMATSLIIMMFILFLKHRGIMHKWYSGVFLGSLFYLVFGNPAISIFFVAGFFTHLLCDIQTGD